MRKQFTALLWAGIMTAVLPALIVSLALRHSRGEQETEQTTLRLCACVRDGENVTVMDMDEYLTGVVLAEMPAEFELEALKAQAVASRTYAAKTMMTGNKHGDGSICTDSTCCQGYIDPAECSDKQVCSVRRAVENTSGEVLTYEGELIEAVYFSCSGGSTEDAVAVWGTDYPYLRATDSPGEEGAAHYSDTVILTARELGEKLGRTLSGIPTQWFTDITYTAGGGVDTIKIAGESYTGTRLRSLLGLRSTAFSIEVRDNAIQITTRGYGHRVGMSQYGADAMAAAGSDYCAILTHYYAGTELTPAAESPLANYPALWYSIAVTKNTND